MAVEDGQSQNGIDRRKALKRIGSVAAIGAVGVAGIGVLSGPAFAIDAETFTADDVGIFSKNGKVEDVWLKPALTYSWDGLDSAPETIEFTMSVENPALDGTFAVLGSETDTSLTQALVEENGEYTFQNRLSLIEDGPWDETDFRARGSHSPKVTGPIGVTAEAVLTTAGGGSFTDAKTDGFTVTTTNATVKFGDGSGGTATGGGVGGNAGTGGN